MKYSVTDSASLNKSMNNEQAIVLSSDKSFFTLEGEGASIGRPSVFLRLSGCNLTCRGWASPENPNGCDSYTAWSVKNRTTFSELTERFKELGHFAQLKNGAILKLTGGEPLLQQKALLAWVNETFCDTIPAIEFETNATIMPDPDWSEEPLAAAFVCSPKLSNNGDPVDRRYKPAVLEWHAHNPNSTFKYVIRNEQDFEELFTYHIDAFKIPHYRVWLMPECATTPQFKQRAPWVAELCKKQGFNFSPRLQILIWEQALGV